MPHSEIVGSQLGSSSPTLIAAAHVLLRHSTPRHPPHACSSFFLCPPSPATTTNPRTRTPRLRKRARPCAGSLAAVRITCHHHAPGRNSVNSRTHSSTQCHLARPTAVTTLHVAVDGAAQTLARGLVVMSLQLLRCAGRPPTAPSHSCRHPVDTTATALPPGGSLDQPGGQPAAC